MSIIFFYILLAFLYKTKGPRRPPPSPPRVYDQASDDVRKLIAVKSLLYSG